MQQFSELSELRGLWAKKDRQADRVEEKQCDRPTLIRPLAQDWPQSPRDKSNHGCSLNWISKNNVAEISVPGWSRAYQISRGWKPS